MVKFSMGESRILNRSDNAFDLCQIMAHAGCEAAWQG